VLSRRLTHTSTELEKLKTLSKVRYETVLQILSDCKEDILFYLTSYSVCQAFTYTTYHVLTMYFYRL